MYTENTSIYIKVPTALKFQVQRKAKQEDMTLSRLIRKLLKEYVEDETC